MKKIGKRFIKSLNSISSIMVINFSVVVLLTISIFISFSIHNTNNALKERSTQYSLELVKQTSNSIDGYIREIEMLLKILLDNENVNIFLDGNNDVSKSIESLIENILEHNKEIYNIVIINRDNDYIINDGGEKLNEYNNFISTPWFLNLLKANVNTIEVSPSHVQNAIEGKYQWVVTVSIRIADKVTGKQRGIIFADLNYDVISNICEEAKLNSREYLYIIDDNENIIYHPKQKLLLSGLKEELIEEIITSNKETLLYSDENGEKIYSNHKSDNTDWTTIGVYYTDDFIENKVYRQYILIGIFLITISFIVALISAKRISKPIKNLKRAMEGIQGENIVEYKVKCKGGSEIISLSKSFEKMLVRIDFLIKENIKEQKEKRNSEMRALQSQINPHFLYNTLDSVIWLVESKNNNEAILMISALSRLFRQAIGNSNMYTSIKEELEYTRSYLTIQKMRYSDKFDFEIEIEKEVENGQIIKMIIQPIVENSLYHGLKYKDGIGYIKVVAYKNNSSIVIQINDNGVGVDKETLNKIFDSKYKKKGNGVGVRNIKKRLELTYGKEYELNIFSKVNIGTTVIIKIPYESNNE